jgi:hypothetical protein
MKRLVGACVILAAIGRIAMADTVMFEGTVGSAPKGWLLTKTGKGDPMWTVEQDQTAPSKGNVLKQSGKATFPLAMKERTNLKDGFVEVIFGLDGAFDLRRGGSALAIKGPAGGEMDKHKRDKADDEEQGPEHQEALEKIHRKCSVFSPELRKDSRAGSFRG